MDKRLALALKYFDAQLIDEAWAALADLAMEPNPGADVLRFAAALRMHAGAFAEAAALCERIGDAEALGLKGQALHRLGDLAGAEAALRAAIAARDPNPHAWNDLGNVLDDLGRGDEAVAAFNNAIAQAPDLSAAHNNLGAHRAGEGRYAAAAACYRNALAHDQHNASAHLNLGVALLEQGRVDEATRAFDAALALAPENSEAADNRLYSRMYVETDPAAIHDAHARWGKGFAPAPALKAADGQRRLRVGYLSPDFRRHSVSFFTEPLLAAHDPAAVEVYCYADGLRSDAITARLKSAAHHWRAVHGMNDAALHKLIQDDRIDVLVDLAGHTQGNRLTVFARRAAPVQITALGYPATTGLPAMDYRLADLVCDPPPQADAWSAEKLLRLETGLHCYQPPASAPAPGPLPALEAGYVTFGSFNKLAKISDATIAVWAGALTVLPTARLLIKSKPLIEPETRAALAARFAAQGIEPKRIAMVGWEQDDAAHLGLYRCVDVALDTFPYNGTTTTCEALWMGVPVLTLAGEGHAARVSASLLGRVGLADWVAVSAKDFADKACRLTADLGGLAHLRAGLRAQVAASPLCDAKAYARAVEDAYRFAWRKAGER